MALAPEAEIGWFDMYDKAHMAAAITAATRMKWLNSIYAGVDGMPLDLLAERGTVVTNGAGINAITIAEYVVMGMLTVAKGYREVVRAQERRSEEHTSELQSLMRISYAVFCLKKKKHNIDKR